MSLQNIQLPPLVIADLYGNVLLNQNQKIPEITFIPAKEKNTSESLIKYLGNNEKKISIIVHQPNDAFLADEHLQFISKMLSACKMNLGDVAIVNITKHTFDIIELKKQLQPFKILLFGVSPMEVKLPMDFPHFKLQEYGGCTYLYGPALEELNNESDNSKLLKSKLWICLKSMFEC